MTKMLLTLAMMLTVSGASAQQTSSVDSLLNSVKADSAALTLASQVSSVQKSFTLPEPDFIGSYCILTSDSTFAVLPKENGKIAKHKSKAGSILSKIGKVADVVGAVGGLGMAIGANASSLSAVITGAKAANTALSVSNVADAAGALAGANGMDIVFAGKTSAYVHKKDGRDVRVLIKADNNEYDPQGLYRVVKFVTSKKERRIQWLEFDSAVFDESKKKKGYIPFTAKKHGEQSYILTIPESEMEEGEYGIFYMGLATAQVIPVGTFSVS